MQTSRLTPWRGPLGLLLLGLVSISLGVLQARGLITATPEDLGDTPARYLQMPVPILVHILAGILVNLLVPLQFVSVIRKGWPRFHRGTGRFLAVCVLLVGITSLWMNEFYPAFGGIAKYLGVVMHSVVLVGGLAWALAAIRQGQVRQHRLGMMCMTAAALSPATQRLIMIPTFVILGEVSDWMIGAAVWFGLLFNLAIVALISRKKKSIPVYVENK